MGQVMKGSGLKEISMVMLVNKGTYKWKSGAIYKGDWKDNKKHGKGIMTSANGRVYEGDFIMNMRDGIGW